MIGATVAASSLLGLGPHSALNPTSEKHPNELWLDDNISPPNDTPLPTLPKALVTPPQKSITMGTSKSSYGDCAPRIDMEGKFLG